MKKKIEAIFRIFLIVLMITPYFIYPAKALAASNRTIKTLRSELAELEREKAEQANKKKLTQNEINSNKNAINAAANEQEKIKVQVAEAEELIIKSEEEIEVTKVQTQEVLTSLQTSEVQNQMLEFIAEAQTTTDFVIHAAIVDQLTKHNEETLSKLNALIVSNEKLKVDLAEKNKQLEANIIGYTQAVNKLGDEMAAISDTYADIDTRIKAQQNQINYYKTICASEDQPLSQCEANITNVSGWKRPLVRARITSGFGNRSGGFHYGTDMGGLPEGTPIYAAAGGRVSEVWPLTNCGGNVVFINHIVNGEQYTTEYAHLLTINVSLGQIVTADTMVGTLGGSSTKYYDRCTSGAHLHFNVAKGHYKGTGSGSYTSWSTYHSRSFKPTWLPGVGTWFYSR